MSANLPKKLKILSSGEDQEICFDRSITYRLELSDFIRSNITGFLASTDEAINKNFESCILNSLSIENLELVACDFLDSTLNEVEFLNSHLDGTHFHSCLVVNSEFRNVKISLTNFTENTFENCIFVDCEFHRFIFKKCEFINCEFVNCTTTNKLFDLCFIQNTKFENSDLQIDTITDNIGIRSTDCRNVQFRTARAYHEHKTLSFDSVIKELERQGPAKPGLAEISKNYFISGMGPDCFLSISKALEDFSWIKTKAYSSIATNFNMLAKFLIGSYSAGELFLLPLLRLQDFLNTAASSLSMREERAAFPLLQTIHGLRLQLAEINSQFFDILDAYSSRFEITKKLALDGRGIAEIEYFNKLLNHIDEYITIDHVRVRNSPLDVAITVTNSVGCWLLLSTILATRYRQEFTRLKKSSEKIKKLPVSLRKTNHSDTELAHRAVTIGPLKTKDKDIGIQVISLYNNGICKKLHLGFSFKRAIEINKSILGLRKLLSDDGSEIE